MIWFIAICLTIATAWFVLAPMLRNHEAGSAQPDVSIYKAQLAEVDREVERGALEAEDAERARVEISRRLISAAKTDASNAGEQKSVSPTFIIGAIALLAIASVGIYWKIGAPAEPDQPLQLRLENALQMRLNRPSQAEMVAAAPDSPPVDAPAEYVESVEQLRILVPTRPNDLKGWELLAVHEAELLNFSAAADAQSRVIALKEVIEVTDYVRLLDLMVFAANGFVSPEAETVALKIREIEPNNTAASYYFGALNDQTGRPDRAFGLWRPLVESDGDTFHIALARAQIANAASRAGISYEAPALRGPDLATIEAANDLTPEERNEMVRGMVAQLSDRLATQGGSAAEWARLIRAHGVLGDRTTARAVYTEALSVFGTDANAVAALDAAANSAGVNE